VISLNANEYFLFHVAHSRLHLLRSPFLIGLVMVFTLCVLEARSVVDVPLLASAWTTYRSSSPFNLPDGSLALDLNNAGYLFTKPAKKAKKKAPIAVVLPSLADMSTLVITARIVTTGTPEFVFGVGPDPCGTPASAHPLLWRAGDVGKFNDEYARWWGHVPIWLATGPDAQTTFRIPLTVDMWSSVFGKYPDDPDPEAMAGWQRTLAGPVSVGLTFSGGCSYGHGVQVVNGTAQFELMEMRFE
jgi:hypothetical protein